MQKLNEFDIKPLRKFKQFDPSGAMLSVQPSKMKQIRETKQASVHGGIYDSKGLLTTEFRQA